ncbi:MAG: tetratricopeptide repeat protein [Thermodesulfobacteriota bacterium]
MDESNAFTKKHVEEVTAAQRTLLDELNLPSAVKQYILDNARLLQVSFILIVGAICGWSYYSYYTDTKNDQAAQQLTQAMLMTDPDQKVISLEKISDEFSGTGSALWGQMSLAGDYINRGEYGNAISILQETHKDVGGDNPLFPLFQQFSGVAYELNGDFDIAIQHYISLSSLPGFAALGYIESGRVYELTGKAAEAKDAYEKANTSKDIKPDQRAWVQEKINNL